MQKVVQFLEKNVEWVAVTLGAAFLLWMVWTYLITNYVSQNFNGQIVTPSNVDDVIAAGPAADLDRLTQNNIRPQVDVPDFTSLLKSGLDLGNVKTVALKDAWDFEPLNLGGGGNGGGGQQGAQGPQVASGKIINLPNLPPAVPMVVATGQTTILDPDKKNADVNWAAVIAYIPEVQLNQEWKNDFGPPADNPKAAPRLSDDDGKTSFLYVNLYRSQQNADGSWSDEKEISRLGSSLPAYPGNDKASQSQYLTSIAGVQTEVVTPKFPDVAPGTSGTTPPDSTKLVADALNGNKPAAGAGAAAPAAGGAAPAAGNPGPAVNTEPVSVVGTNLPTVAPTARTALFNPAIAPTTPDNLVCLYDTTLKPNVKYRYRIAYALSNPMFNQNPNRAGNITIVNQFELKAPLKDYSPDVSVESKTRFYLNSIVAAAGRAAGSSHDASFNVHVFTNGQWQVSNFKVSPGDPIGGASAKDSVDYSTGYTYVDTMHVGTGTGGGPDHVAYMDDLGGVTVVGLQEETKKEKDVFPPTPPAAAGAGAGAASDNPAPASPAGGGSAGTAANLFNEAVNPNKPAPTPAPAGGRGSGSSER